jgi:transposase-like protein
LRLRQERQKKVIDEVPQTLIYAVQYFADLDRCNEFMAEVKWQSGKITCPHCGGESVSPVKGRPKLQCNSGACRKQFSYKTGTIFEDSPLPLSKWFVAVWFVVNCKNGISSHEMHRAIGVTQKTGWFMCHRIRKALESGSFAKLAGEVESDETFVGGAAKNMHRARREAKIKGRGSVGKQPVHGILERGGMVGAYIHHAVDHGAGEYVRGPAHTNGLENFWSLLNRALKGTWTHVEPFHLHRYTTEQGFRYNHRDLNDALRFLLALRGVLGKRLTYRRLCAIGDSGFMGLK